ncbi:vWA domain-containing protein [Halosolutus gelatinilyticus]|uniref:vWA domain-containing protein n=1 Tax=Halosolutus gelatinilyticus TaxID=2931975 RepID=UPI001FF0EC76|nr:VWA domain-containing protein [Halosolutus gelatinilyticus]
MPSERRRFLALCGACTGSTIAGCSTLADRSPWSDESDGVDDWQYSPPDEDDGGWHFGGTDAAFEADAASAGGEPIGLAAGGAADVGTFRRNVYEGYLPIPESMASEGLFHEYYFDTAGDGSCGSLFCPTYTPAVSPDPLSGETERYLSVGMDSGLSQSDFERPPLNLVIVLDISGSMSASFSDYYYDAYGNEREAEGDTSQPKIDVAKDALVSLTRHLRPDDRLGVVLFNHEAHLAKPLRAVEETDMDAIRGHIQDDIRATGGTNVSAAMERSEEVIAEYGGADRGEYENRSILITDAQINVGETDADELRGSLEANADRGHHTTVIGVGVDFNADLIDQITAVRGANYYSVYSAEEFERRVDDGFEYMVTPLVYGLSLELDAEGYEIAGVYGSDAAEPSTGELMRVNTLFPSERTDGEAKGGVVLVRIERTDDAESSEGRNLTLEASWETRSGDRESTTEDVSIPSGNEEYGNGAVRKAILLARYADLLTNWTVYERDETLVDEREGIDRPPAADRLGEWELESDPLSVSDRYESRLGAYREYLDAEMDAIDDADLGRELELLDEILAAT